MSKYEIEIKLRKIGYENPAYYILLNIADFIGNHDTPKEKKEALDNLIILLNGIKVMTN